jgi:hypothetical protein
MKKVQIPVMGGMRKVIQPGASVAAGTTIAEFGSGTVGLAQLAALITQIQAQQAATGGGNIGDGTEAYLSVGPGLAGGGPMLGNVNLRLTIPPALIAEDGVDGDPGLQGVQGIQGIPGTSGTGSGSAPVLMLFPDDAVDNDTFGLLPIPSVSAAGAAGTTGSPGAPGLSVYLLPEDGQDGDWGPPGIAGVGIAGATGATGATGASGLTWIPEDSIDNDTFGLIPLPSPRVTNTLSVSYPPMLFQDDVQAEELMPQVVPNATGPLTVNGQLNVASAGNAIALNITGAPGTTIADLMGPTIAVAQFRSSAATNKSVFIFLQALTGPTGAFSIGLDGSQAILTDSANGDVVISCASTASYRWGLTGGTSQMVLTTSGGLKIPVSPLLSTQTQVQTGLANFKATSTISTGTALTADASLTVTCNETGWYDANVYLSFVEATLGTGGFQFDFAGGSAVFGTGTFNIGVSGFSTVAVTNAAITSSATATSFATITTSTAAPSWVKARGNFQVITTGTVAIRWAQASALSADATSLNTGSHIILTKIG